MGNNVSTPGNSKRESLETNLTLEIIGSWESIATSIPIVFAAVCLLLVLEFRGIDWDCTLADDM